MLIVLNIFCRFNKFKRIPPLQPTTLTRFSLKGNRIQDATFPSSFSRSGKLQSVILSHNRIASLDSSFLASMRTVHVENLDLSSNRLESIDSKAFAPVVESLQILTLDHNKLGAPVIAKALKALAGSASSLVTLSLESNGLVQLEEDFLKGLEHSKVSWMKGPSHS